MCELKITVNDCQIETVLISNHFSFKNANRVTNNHFEGMKIDFEDPIHMPHINFSSFLIVLV